MIPTTAYVALGGAIGAVLRYLVNLAVGGAFATATVNILGGFIMGCAFVYLSLGRGPEWFQPMIMTGVLGGFTTFSAFSLDALKMVEADNLIGAGLYVILSVVFSLIACGVGIWITRGLMT